jgi:hypothetical protein
LRLARGGRHDDIRKEDDVESLIMNDRDIDLTDRPYTLYYADMYKRYSVCRDKMKCRLEVVFDRH